MKLIRTLNKNSHEPKMSTQRYEKGIFTVKNASRNGCVLTVGNFDGVHLGHQAILRQVKTKADQAGLLSAVLLFEPQPLEFFSGTQAPARLMTLREKYLALRQMQVDQLFCLRFNQSLAQYSPQEFIERILINGCNAKQVIVGDDFHFGQNRAGNFDLLQQYGQMYGFQVTRTETIEQQGQRVSSTRVREALWAGCFKQASILLGRPFSFSGRVVYGDGLGQKLGFPTANILLHRRVSPVRGVFAVQVESTSDEILTGVANVGLRPTISGDHQARLEVHLFDYDLSLYGKRLTVTFLKKFRDEQKFENIEQLKAAIKQDVDHAKRYFTGFTKQGGHHE